MTIEIKSDIIVAKGPEPRAGSWPSFFIIEVMNKAVKLDVRSVINIEIEITNAM